VPARPGFIGSVGRVRSSAWGDLALLVHAQHHRLIRRVQVQAHHVGELRYGSSVSSVGFAVYPAARNRHEHAAACTWLALAAPREAFGAGCPVHLAGIDHRLASGGPVRRSIYDELAASAD